MSTCCAGWRWPRGRSHPSAPPCSCPPQRCASAHRLVSQWCITLSGVKVSLDVALVKILRARQAGLLLSGATTQRVCPGSHSAFNSASMQVALRCGLARSWQTQGTWLF